MDSKIELTKSQLETILRLINDINLNNEQSTGKILTNVDNKNDMKLKKIPKKRSYSAINFKNIRSTDDLLNESFRDSIKKSIEYSKKYPKFPEIKTANIQQNQTKLKRNKSLIELRKEKWDQERNELKESDSWYEKFDSYKKTWTDRSKSQPNSLNYMPYNQFRSASRLQSPISPFDNDSLTLSNLHSPITRQSIQYANKCHSNHQSNFLSVPESENQISYKLIDELINQPKRSFRRYTHESNNINLLEKRRKQQEYRGQLEAQLNYKREMSLKRKEQQQIDDEKLEEKLMIEQTQLKKEFELDHFKSKLIEDADQKIGDKKMDKKISTIEKLEMKGEELIKVFKEASTQTEEINYWKTAQINDNLHQSTLQPIRSNRSALLGTINKCSLKPKWTKQSKDEAKPLVFPRLNQKGNQLRMRKN